MNVSDSERIATKLDSLGYQSAPDEEGADLVVLNMCSVRQSAVDRVYGQFRKMRRSKKKYLLTGCILRSDVKKLEKELDYIVSINTLPYWEDILDKESFHYYPNMRDDIIQEKYGLEYLDIEPRYSNNFSAFIPIASGCDNFCTYCVVPFTRGPLRSRSFTQIIKEAQDLIDKGTKEIWLVSQNADSYDYEGKRLVHLLQEIAKIPGEFWVNFTSSHPKDFTDDLIQEIADNPKLSNYISLPIQSGDDAVLRRMNRPYSLQEYKDLVYKIKSKVSDVYISTDIIVGFPGETEEQFKNTINLFKELEFDMAYIAEYSPRPHTAADKWEDDVSKEDKIRRREELTDILKEINLKKNKKYIGKELDILVSEKHKNHLLGKTPNYRTVKITDVRSKDLNNLLGEVVRVKITNAIPWGLEGNLV